MPFLLAEILDFQGSAHLIGVGSLSNTYFKDFANPDNKKQGRTFESFNARFLDEIDFDAYWGAPHNRARLSSDPGNKFKTEKQD